MVVVSMEFSLLDNQRYQIKGQTEPPTAKKDGIAGYNHFVGWILKVFGYAIALKDDNNVTFYLNRKSTIHWLQRHGIPNLEENTNGSEVVRLINKAVAIVLPTQVPNLQEPNASSLQSNTWGKFEDLPEELRRKIYADIPDKDIGKLVQVSRKMEETILGQALARQFKVYLKSKNFRDLKQFLEKNIDTKLSWNTVSRFTLEEKWEILSLFDNLQQEWVLIRVPPKYNHLIANLAKVFLADNDFRFLNLKSPNKYKFLEAFNRCCVRYADNIDKYDDFLPSCYERLERRYPDETFFQQLSVHYKAYKVLQWINTLPEKEAAERIAEEKSDFLKITGDSTRDFVKAIIEHLPTEKYPFFFRLNIYHPASIKTFFIMDLNTLERDKWGILCREILKTHYREDSLFKLRLNENTLLCLLIDKIKTKEDLQIAIESIPQDATPDQRRWYLQALTRGIFDPTAKPDLPQEEIQSLLDEKGLVIPDQKASFDEEYHTLFQHAYFAD